MRPKENVAQSLQGTLSLKIQTNFLAIFSHESVTLKMSFVRHEESQNLRESTDRKVDAKSSHASQWKRAISDGRNGSWTPKLAPGPVRDVQTAVARSFSSLLPPLFRHFHGTLHVHEHETRWTVFTNSRWFHVSSFFPKHFLVDRPTFDGTWNNFFRTAGTLFVHGFGIVPKRKKLTGAKDRLKIPWNVSWPRMRPFCGTGEYTKRPLNE